MRKLSPSMRTLASTPMFRDLTRRELHEVQQLGSIVDVGRHRVLGLAGVRPRQVGVVVGGEVQATTAHGRRRVLRTGDGFGAVSAQPNRFVEPETFETITPATLFVLSRLELGVLRHSCPRLAARLEHGPDILKPEPVTVDVTRPMESFARSTMPANA